MAMSWEDAAPSVAWLGCGAVQCPRCRHADTRVVDSRPADDGTAVRRRRACAPCGYRFTTFERAEATVLLVRKRSGDRVPFQLDKVVRGVRAACKGRPVGDDDVAAIAAAVESQARASGGDLSTEQVGLAVLEQLKRCDHVAYLRFASVYKGFADASDFLRELELLEGSGSAV
jgi:transcriptional repressor NrdR